MKTNIALLVLGIVLFNSVNLYAQWTLGGNLWCYYQNNDYKNNPNVLTDNNKYSDINITPSVGYYLNSQIVIGITAGVDINKYNTEYNYRNDLSSNYSRQSKYFGLTGGSYIKYYKSFSEKISFCNTLTLYFENGVNNVEESYTSDTYISKSIEKEKGINLAYTPALSFKINDHVNLELSFAAIYFGKSKSKTNNWNEDRQTGVKTNEISLDGSSDFNVGIYYNQFGIGINYKF